MIPLVVMINLGAWNVRGLNKTHKQLEVAKFLGIYNLSLGGLLETKIKRTALGALYLRIFPSWCITRNLAWHDGGHIIVGWKSEDVSVDILRCSSQFIHVYYSPIRCVSFYCSFEYGSLEKQGKLQLFHDLQEISTTTNSPWIILGDFNYVSHFDERHGQPVRLQEIKPFRESLDWYGVHDLHYSGLFFTWSYKQASQNRVMNKIDRVLSNDL